MKYSSEIVRNTFIDFFKNKGHKFVRSAPVIPIGDPTLLFTNAGMNQFKDLFLGKKESSFTRATNSQKCIRVSGKHNDLEEVGVDNYHHTFFEMLGNWSFGDYYKKDAIIWSWDLLTNVWKLDKNRIWISVYEDDEEAKNIWIENTDVNPNRILKFGKKENFWEMGDVGPCGPCSEIHYYTGKNIEKQDASGVNNTDEYREFWNLVFIEFNRNSSGDLVPLDDKHVDTGMGLERMVAILNGVESNYDTDLFLPIIEEIVEKTGKKLSFKSGIPHRVIADHIRMLACAISDGVMPSNEGRGYVVRRVLRRASRFARVLDMKDAFLYTLVDKVVDVLGQTYNELKDKSTHVKKVIKNEEISFGRTLDRGLLLIDELINDKRNLSGKDAFKLYDTYGFPIDLTKLIAAEKNVSVDEDEFDKFMKIQKENAKKNQKFKLDEDSEKWNILNNNKGNDFIGYIKTEIRSKLTKYRIVNNDKIEIVSKATPFYAESGGQIGDTGIIKANGLLFSVIDTYKLVDEIVHLCEVENGNIKSINKDSEFLFRIDVDRRNLIKSNHTATHLLHKALKIVIGEHVQQAGSLVSDDKLRFDLTHYEKITDKEISDIERLVNNVVKQNIALKISIEDFDEAQSKGAEALFGEKYEDEVRVIDIDGFSMELCGGTHVDRTGDVGLFKIISESSLASGIRRIEAVTGKFAFDYLFKDQMILSEVQSKIQCNKEDIPKKIDELMMLVKKSEKLQKDLSLSRIHKILYNKEGVNNHTFICHETSYQLDPKLIVDIFNQTYSKQSICLISILANKPLLVLCVTKDLVSKINAGNFIQDIGKEFGSGGGGPAHFGTTGFKNIDILNKAFKKASEKIKGIL